MSTENAKNAAPVDGIVITPGPWEASGNGVHKRVSSHYATCVATTVGDQRYDNAKAIAAVPELIELVCAAYRGMNRGQWEDGETDAELCNRINDTMCNHFGNDWLA